jgi:pyruvate ferredoxin oxidoreductase gamma subunit
MLLAKAAMKSGKYVQAFPEYGPERAGAPVTAFTRLSTEPIRIHSSVVSPDAVVILDARLLRVINATESIKEGYLVINTPQPPAEVRKAIGSSKAKLATVDATKIARELTGSAIPNIVLLGALAKINETISREDLMATVEEEFSRKLGAEKIQANKTCIEKAYREVKIA